MFVYLIALLLPFSIYATVFKSQPVGQQVSESDGIMVGNYIRKKYVQLENGSIATQMIFKVKKEVGLHSDSLGLDEVIVHYPGGKIGDNHVIVEGIPEFVPGEHVVIMIKNHEDRFWGMNLAFGTFRVINYGKHKVVVNSVFPQDVSAGQMKLEAFEKLVGNLKGTRLKEVYVNNGFPSEISGQISTSRSPASFNGGKNRAIASIQEEVENEIGRGISTWWLILVLAAMGGVFRFIRRRSVR